MMIAPSYGWFSFGAPEILCRAPWTLPSLGSLGLEHTRAGDRSPRNRLPSGAWQPPQPSSLGGFLPMLRA